MSTNTRKYYELWFLPIFLVQLTLLCYAINLRASSTVPEWNPTFIKWNPVCRHKTLYWASMVGENYLVRIAYGNILRQPHVQPQIKLGDNWYYFEIENDKVVLINMPSFEFEYSMSFLQFAEMHNYWLKKEQNKDEHRE